MELGLGIPTRQPGTSHTESHGMRPKGRPIRGEIPMMYRPGLAFWAIWYRPGRMNTRPRRNRPRRGPGGMPAVAADGETVSTPSWPAQEATLGPYFQRKALDGTRNTIHWFSTQFRPPVAPQATSWGTWIGASETHKWLIVGWIGSSGPWFWLHWGSIGELCRRFKDFQAIDDYKDKNISDCSLTIECVDAYVYRCINPSNE